MKSTWTFSNNTHVPGKKIHLFINTDEETVNFRNMQIFEIIRLKSFKIEENYRSRPLCNYSAKKYRKAKLIKVIRKPKQHSKFKR